MVLYKNIDFYDRLRVETIIHLDSVLPNVEGHEDFERFFSDFDIKKLKRYLPEICTDSIKDPQSLAEELDHNGRRGYLVLVACVIREYISEDTHYSGWGKCQTKWFYGDEISDILVKE